MLLHIICKAMSKRKDEPLDSLAAYMRPPIIAKSVDEFLDTLKMGRIAAEKKCQHRLPPIDWVEYTVTDIKECSNERLRKEVASNCGEFLDEFANIYGRKVSFEKSTFRPPVTIVGFCITDFDFYWVGADEKGKKVCHSCVGGYYVFDGKENN